MGRAYADALYLRTVVTDGSLAASQNDYQPTGGAEAGIWALGRAGGVAVITGIAAPSSVSPQMKMLRLINIDANPIILQHELIGSSSSPTNEIVCPNDMSYVLQPDGMVDLIYYAARWHVLASDVGVPMVVASEAELLSIYGRSTSKNVRAIVDGVGEYTLRPATSGTETASSPWVLAAGPTGNGWWYRTGYDEPGAELPFHKREVVVANTPTVLVSIPTRNTGISFAVEVLGTVRDVGNGDSGSWRLFAAFERTTTVVSQIGTTEKVAKLEAGLTTADLDFQITSQSIEVLATPETDNNCRFRVIGRMLENRL